MKDFNMNKFKGLLKSKNMRLEPQDTFNSIDEPITWICHRCNHTFTESVKNFIAFPWCPWCDKKKETISLNELKKILTNKYGDEYITMDENFDKKKTQRILVKHSCGFIFASNWKNLVGGQGCPKCKNRTLEMELIKYLEKAKIPFIHDVRKKDSIFRLQKNNVEYTIYLYKKGDGAAKIGPHEIVIHDFSELAQRLDSFRVITPDT